MGQRLLQKLANTIRLMGFIDIVLGQLTRMVKRLSIRPVYLRHPDVFLKTVVHSASRGFESSFGSCSHPE